jgi:uncharacterized protein
MTLRIEVICALPSGEDRLMLEMHAGSTVRDAIQASGLLTRHPDMAIGPVGIWGRAVTPQSPLRHRDRVEVYRPLKADPKEIRRKRAAGSGK